MYNISKVSSFPWREEVQHMSPNSLTMSKLRTNKMQTCLVTKNSNCVHFHMIALIFVNAFPSLLSML